MERKVLEGFDVFLEHMQILQEIKNKEYSTADAFYNFNVGANILGSTPEKAAFAYMAKHIASVSKMVKNPDKYSNESWLEKLGDIAIYCGMIYAMRFDKKQNKISLENKEQE